MPVLGKSQQHGLFAPGTPLHFPDFLQSAIITHSWCVRAHVQLRSSPDSMSPTTRATDSEIGRLLHLRLRPLLRQHCYFSLRRHWHIALPGERILHCRRRALHARSKRSRPTLKARCMPLLFATGQSSQLPQAQILQCCCGTGYATSKRLGCKT